MRAWQDAGLRMRVAVNLSVHQMRQDDLVQRIRRTLERHRVDAALLTFEITESVAMEDTLATMRRSASSHVPVRRWRSTTSAPATRAWLTCARCRRGS